jgi:hypothetical protein
MPEALMSYMTRLAAHLGYALHNGIAYGRTNGIYFNAVCAADTTVTVRAYIRPLESLTFRDVGRGAGIDLIRISEYLKVRKREYPNSGAQADERSVWVVLDGGPISKVSQFISEFSRYLSEMGYVSSCAACPETRRLSYACLDGQLLEVCGPCRDSLGAVPVGEVSEASLLLRGILGATGGALIVGVLWALLHSVWLVASLCGLMMAYIADKSYLAAGGRRGRAEALIIAAVLIVMTFAAVTGGYALGQYRLLLRQGIDAAFFPLVHSNITVLLNGGAADVLWIRLGVGWLFSALGGLSLILRQRRDKASRSKTALPKTAPSWRRRG